MGITRDQVEYVANLSRLSLSEDEKDRFAGQLDAILESINKLDELDTKDVEPLIHISPRNSVFRPDETRESLPRDDALHNAPEKSEGAFKVPRVVD